MDIETVLRKLEPLLPDDVLRWRRILDLAEPETKGLVQQQVIATAYKLLGNFRNKVLLSLPPKSKSRGAFHLGTVVYESEKWPFGLSSGELLQNMTIFGRAGAGKTNIAFQLLGQLVERRVPLVLFDVKRTGRHLIPLLGTKLRVYTPGRELSPFPFNPFIAPPGLEPNVYINHVVDALGDAFTLGDGARSLLQRGLADCYSRGNRTPTAFDLLEVLKAYAVNERSRGWRISAVRALESLVVSFTTGKDPAAQEAFAHQLTAQHTVIELDALSRGALKFLVPLLAFWIYCTRLNAPSREQLSLVLFLEEAHHFVYRQEHRAKESLMNTLLRQGREIGLAFILLDQHPHLISAAALGNAYTSICMSLKDSSDITKAAQLSLVDPEDTRCFGQLPVGYAVVKLQDRWTKPVLLKSPLLAIEKGIVTDELLAQYIKALESRSSGRIVPLDDLLARVRQIRFGEKGLNEHALALLEDVLAHPDDGVRQRYLRLGLNIDKGHALKQELIRDGWLHAQIISLGRTRKQLLRLTDNAHEWLGTGGKETGPGSLAHEHFKRLYANWLKSRGYRVRLEAPRVGGRVDVLAAKGGRLIGVEIETGESDFVSNVKNGLISHFNDLVIVATTDAAMKNIEHTLAREGLLIPGRVTLVLRDRFTLRS